MEGSALFGVSGRLFREVKDRTNPQMGCFEVAGFNGPHVRRMSPDCLGNAQGALNGTRAGRWSDEPDPLLARAPSLPDRTGA